MANFLNLAIGPAFDISGNTDTLATAFALNGSTDQAEYIFLCEADDTITTLGFRYSVRTGTPPTYIISLQGVGADGNPDGTVLGGGSPASATFTPPADATWNSTWREVTLANPIALTAGTYYAMVIAYSSGTVDGSNNSSFTLMNTGIGSQRSFYTIQNDAGSRTRGTTGIPVFSYKSATSTYGRPMVTVFTTTIDSTTTPDEMGMAFTIPTTWCASYKIRGVRFTGTAAAGKTYKVLLYNGTTVLQTVTLDTDVLGANASTGRFEVYWPTPIVALSAGSTYRISIQPQEAAALIGIRGFAVSAIGDMDAWPGGRNFYYTARTDAGAWSDTTTQKVHMELIISDWTLPTGSVQGIGSTKKLRGVSPRY